MKPEYRFICKIVDTTTGEEVTSGSTIIPNEKRVNDPVFGLENLNEDMAEEEFWSMFRHFRNKGQAEYEQENYSINQDHD